MAVHWNFGLGSCSIQRLVRSPGGFGHLGLRSHGGSPSQPSEAASGDDTVCEIGGFVAEHDTNPLNWGEVQVRHGCGKLIGALITF
jgi:hypothetical protein